MSQDPDVRSFLARIGLSQYADAFETNSIDMTQLASLSAEDMKEIGVGALGHRKLIEAEIRALIQRADVLSTADIIDSISSTSGDFNGREERVYLETEILSDRRQIAKIKITSRRAVLGDKTYALQNIAAVEMHTNEVEIEKAHARAMEIWERALLPENRRGHKRTMLILGAICAVLAVICLFGPSDEKKGAFVSCLGLMALVFFAAMNPSTKQPERGKIFWAVRIQASGTPNDVLTSYDKAKVEEVVDALNDAIVNLNM